ncbi:MAG: ATP-binding protein [Clostridiales bacterium]|nr:ATP-binding protein [Clostridiales bacterium]
MARIFNTEGYCNPKWHYMVDLSERLTEIRSMVDRGQYFSIHRARQYGKTTLLAALTDYLKKDYEIVSLDFQALSSSAFKSESAFVAAFSRELFYSVRTFPDAVSENLRLLAGRTGEEFYLQDLLWILRNWSETCNRKIVLIIDEVDSATNNQIFMDFLAQLRLYYLTREKTATFHSVILAGVYDVRNLKKKLRPEEDRRNNSPWNIAAEFNIDMSFSTDDIAGMLKDYEADFHTGMDIAKMAGLLYDYTSGYPYLVSRLCKLMDERVPKMEPFSDKRNAWTKSGFTEALKILQNEMNPLYQSLKGKLEDYPQLRNVLYELLFTGKPIPYTIMNDYIEIAVMFGFIKNRNGTAVISNRIFETVLYNWFISEEYMNNRMYDLGVKEKNQFIAGGHLNVRRILEKFVETFDDLYGDQEETFLEDVGRRYFMLFLKPIINGVGNCYVEAETRNHERMDLVIDYCGEQFVIELKIWRGNAYLERGEQQLFDYLNYFHLEKGYMLSFNFNKKKEIGVKEIRFKNKVLVEAVV